MQPLDDGPRVLALDIGTSSARAAVFDAAGTELPGTRARAAWRVRTGVDGAAEFDPARLLNCVLRCVGEALDCAGPAAGGIVAVGACCFWHSLVGVDEGLEPVTPILTWADNRPGAVMAELAERIDPAGTYARTGCPFHASYWPAKLTYLRRAMPEASARVRWWLSPPDWLYARLFGRVGTSHSMASATGLYRQDAQAWDAELCAALGVDLSLLPPILEDADAFRGLSGRFAGRWALGADVPWVPAIGDGAASNVGADCLAPRVAALMVGTSAAVRVAGESCTGPLPRGLWRYRLDRRRPLVGGAISNGGVVFQWLQRVLRLPRDFEDRIAAMPPDDCGLTVLPLLMGERTPVWRSDVSGVIAGLREAVGPLDIARAAMEAVAIRCATMVELVDAAAGGPVRLIATGTALRVSPLWPRMIADALARPLEVSPVEEASLRGAALHAARSLGLAPTEPAQPQVQRVVEPRPDAKAVYDRLRDRTQRLYEAHFE